ncbi:hypothetical protein LTR97_001588 [Elasticomyces elasticus]|uniref:Uncharacterized protein n=1 Tax=Elasticomyces elasticus TaxID=574655 RepID=A0AAN7ZQJ0_9PEZI|nr:hypothetical protein LTR97_001588 [Elasticomyces elasticus]
MPTTAKTIKKVEEFGFNLSERPAKPASDNGPCEITEIGEHRPKLMGYLCLKGTKMDLRNLLVNPIIMQAAVDLYWVRKLPTSRTMNLEHTAEGLAWAQKVLAKEPHKQVDFFMANREEAIEQYGPPGKGDWNKDRKAKYAGSILYHCFQHLKQYDEDLADGTTDGEYVAFADARAAFEKAFDVELSDDFDDPRSPLLPGLQRPLCLAKDEGVSEFLNKLRVVLDYLCGVTAADRWVKLWTGPAGELSNIDISALMPKWWADRSNASDDVDTVLENLKNRLNPVQKKPSIRSIAFSPSRSRATPRFAHISPGGDVLTSEEVIVERAMYPPAEVVRPEPTHQPSAPPNWKSNWPRSMIDDIQLPTGQGRNSSHPTPAFVDEIKRAGRSGKDKWRNNPELAQRAISGVWLGTQKSTLRATTDRWMGHIRPIATRPVQRKAAQIDAVLQEKQMADHEAELKRLGFNHLLEPTDRQAKKQKFDCLLEKKSKRTQFMTSNDVLKRDDRESISLSRRSTMVSIL